MNILKEKILKRLWFKPSALLAIFIVAYWVPLKTIVSTWWTEEDYSYGFLIPVISAYILWDKRDALKRLDFKSTWKAFPFLVFFVILSLYGILGSSGNIAMPSIPILIVIFTTFCFGWAVIKEIYVPLGYLIFMIPIPSVLERSLGLFLKDISSKMGAMIIRAFNIPVNLSGNVIDLGVTQLQVVDACNGIRYLFPLLAIGVAYAYFFERVFWKRIAAVLSTIPIAVLTNGLRIGVTGILTEKFGAGMAEGFFHGFSGWLLFMFAFACLYIVGRILALFPPKNKPDIIKKPGEEKYEISSDGRPCVNINRAFYISVILMMIVFVLSFSTSSLPPVKIKGGIAGFPISFSGWAGESQLVSPEIIAESGAEEAFSALYQNNKHDSVSCYIGYRSTAFLSNENFFHSPTVCLPSSGWNIISKSIHVVENVPQFGDVKVGQLIMESMGEKELVYYWFQTKDKTTPYKAVNRYHLTLHALKRDNTYDLFIRPITSVKKYESIEDSQARMDDFVRDMMATLLKYISENQEPGGQHSKPQKVSNPITHQTIIPV